MPGLPPSAAIPGTGPKGNTVGSAPSSRPTAPSSRPTAPSSRPSTTTATPRVKPTTTPAATTGNPPLRPPALPPITGGPSLRSQVSDLQQMGAASRKRQGLTQSFDVYDVVIGHLIDEGYADTEEAATAIMANMSEDWRESIVESIASRQRIIDMRREYENQYGTTKPNPAPRPSGPIKDKLTPRSSEK
jgi:hypothetical protein